MSGQIRFCKYSDLNQSIVEDYDLKLHITRTTKKGIYKGFIHVPQLSPSTQLRDNAIYKWKKLKFNKEELYIMKNGKTGTWFDIYEIQFQKEMDSRSDFIKAYNRLKHHLDNGVNILAVCYCDDAYKCHRSLIHNRLILEGYNSILS